MTAILKWDEFRSSDSGVHHFGKCEWADFTMVHMDISVRSCDFQPSILQYFLRIKKSTFPVWRDLILYTLFSLSS
jgi:uncharacterized membrane protein